MALLTMGDASFRRIVAGRACACSLSLLILLPLAACLEKNQANKAGAHCNAWDVCASGMVCVEGICREDMPCDGTCPGAAPLASRQQGVCQGVKQTCNPASCRWEEPNNASVLPGYESEEQSCDGRDNDCDGRTDEQLTAPNGTCQHRAGVCAQATPLCGGLVGWICQNPATYEAVEHSCDGLDNDCDGETDEVCGCADAILGAVGTQQGDYPTIPGSDQGSCFTPSANNPGGAEQIVEFTIPSTGKWRITTAGTEYDTVLYARKACDDPLTEIACNDDVSGMDGLTSSRIDIQAEAQEIIFVFVDAYFATAPGRWTLNIEPCMAETCNSKDDDCDGGTDEGLGLVHCGTGQCARTFLLCDQGISREGLARQCVPGSPEEEICDGLDNDCDGQTDEGFQVGQFCAGTGGQGSPCGDGVWECDEFGGRRCSTHPGGTQYRGSDEICDGRDNDCDGEIDEGFEAGQACPGTGGHGSPCGPGVWECDALDGSRRCSTHPDGSAFAGSAEACNGLDDDCDGAVDEGCACQGQQQRACGTGLGSCSLGTQTCRGNVWSSCEGAGVPRAEVCDGLDNDCDGRTDEDLAPPPHACRSLGVCAGSAPTCAGPSGWACNYPASYEESETRCDGLDNDCDGVTDSGDPLDPEASPPEQWVLVCPGAFVMGSPGPECAVGCSCGEGPTDCRDPRCSPAACTAPDCDCPGVEPGRFATETEHEVTLTRPFRMQATEVTQAQWQEVMAATPSRFASCGADCPVELVNWFEGVAFANALSRSKGLEPCYENPAGTEYELADAEAKTPPAWPLGLDCPGFRLPTEAEWEYAARSGTATPVYNGGSIPWEIVEEANVPALDPIAWYPGNSGVVYPGGADCSAWSGRQYPAASCGTHTAASKLPNAWQLYDMLGNVWELCWDIAQMDLGATAVVDPLGADSGWGRVARGGSWGGSSNGLMIGDSRRTHAAYRRQTNPDAIDDAVGLRLVRSIR